MPKEVIHDVEYDRAHGAALNTVVRLCVCDYLRVVSREVVGILFREPIQAWRPTLVGWYRMRAVALGCGRLHVLACECVVGRPGERISDVPRGGSSRFSRRSPRRTVEEFGV